MTMIDTVHIPRQRTSDIPAHVINLGCITVNDSTCGSADAVVLHRHLDPRYVLPGRCTGRLQVVASEAGMPVSYFHLVAVSPQPDVSAATALLPAGHNYVVALDYNLSTSRLGWRVVPRAA